MSELIRHFGIDWKLLLAQAVNFFILLFLLWKFAYGPIMDILRKRREEIEKGLKFSRDAAEKLKKIGEEREEVLKEARSQALQVVTNAEQVAKGRKEEILLQAAKKSEALLLEAKRAIGEEKAKMGEEVYKDARELLRLGMSKVLGKMPPEARDSQLIEEAIQELKALR